MRVSGSRSARSRTMRRLLVGAIAIAGFLGLTAAWAIAAGELVFVEATFDGVGGVDGLDDASSVVVSPDGKHAYVAGASDDAVAVFVRGDVTGTLTFVEREKQGVGGVDGLNGARSLAVSPDGGHVYVASLHDTVAVFSRDAVTGELTYVEVERDGVGGVDGLDGAVSIAVSPDGDHVYTAGVDDSAVAVFSRDSSTGEITFVEVHIDEIGSVKRLRQAHGVAVSPDGEHVYAAAALDHAVTVFSRDAATGELTFVGVVRDNIAGVDGLFRARSVTVSPDGAYVYTAASEDNAVAVFSRDATTGELTFVEVEKDGVGGVESLNGAWSVAVGPDGTHVYVASNREDTVTVFSRDESTGELTLASFEEDGVAGVDGIAEANSVTTSPNGSHVYATGGGDEAVAVFSQSGFSRCATLQATITGTSGDDNLQGTAGNDVIHGLGGNDTIDGRGGDDVLCGGTGNDTLSGGPGNDLIGGGLGDDTILGNAGNDTTDYSDAPAAVSVNIRLHRAMGAHGTDDLDSIENVIGSPFDDTLRGDAKRNLIVGRAGDDGIQGIGGDDKIYGELGDDNLNGRRGNDLLHGGPGLDQALFLHSGVGLTVDLRTDGPQVTGDGTDELVGIEDLFGSRFNDMLTGNEKDNVIKGSKGNDDLFGRGGNDLLLGNKGFDTANGGAGIDTCRTEVKVACE